MCADPTLDIIDVGSRPSFRYDMVMAAFKHCLLYTSDAADERSSVDLGGRRIIKKKNKDEHRTRDEH